MTPKEERYQWDKIVGAPGKLLNIQKECLRIDYDYQRSQPSDPKILGYARAWDWALCATLLVADRDGVYYVWDGQHRLLAAMKRSDITHLPCMVYPSKGREWEAAHFSKFNRGMRRPTPHERFKADLVAQDPIALDMHEFTLKRGYTISSCGNATNIDCVGTLRQYFEDSPEFAKNALDLCITITAGKFRITQDMLRGAMTLVANGVKLDATAIDHLHRAGEIKIAREIMNQKIADNSTGSRAPARALLRIANDGRRKEKRVFLKE